MVSRLDGVAIAVIGVGAPQAVRDRLGDPIQAHQLGSKRQLTRIKFGGAGCPTATDEALAQWSTGPAR